MLYNEQMNATVHLNFAVQITGRFFALSFIALASAAANLDLASSALLPSGTGIGSISQNSLPVNPP
jgi:hypothetical protein